MANTKPNSKQENEKNDAIGNTIMVPLDKTRLSWKGGLSTKTFHPSASNEESSTEAVTTVRSSDLGTLRAFNTDFEKVLKSSFLLHAALLGLIDTLLHSSLKVLPMITYDVATKATKKNFLSIT